MHFDKHIFICTNQKVEGKPCCGEGRGMELVQKFRSVLNEKGLKGIVRAQRAGCLDACDFGPSVAIYPDGIYYKGVTPDDVERIVNEHVIGGKVVGGLELTLEEKKQKSQV